MRPQLRDTLAIFVEGAMPVDASFYQAHGADVQNLAEHIATRIKVRASVTPPEDLLNYYSIGVDAKRNGNRVRLTVLVSGRISTVWLPGAPPASLARSVTK